MKTFKFHEYMNSKKKITSPVVDPLGDQIDPKTSPNKPPKEGYAKGGKEYSTGAKKTKTGGQKGLGDLGDKKTIYKPDIKNPHGATPAKIPTVEQIQLANAMVQDMLSQPSLIEHFIRQAKQNGLLGGLVAEVFEQQDSAKHLAKIMSHETYGPKVCRNLTKALNEEVAPAYAGEIQGTEDDEEEENPDADPDATEEEGDGEGIPDPDVEHQPDPNNMMGQDPNMQMDPNMMQDPNMMGMQPPMDPSMMQQGQIDPMTGQPMMPQQPPMPPQQPPMPMQQPMMMKQFQKAMMRAYQRAMMRKQ